MKQYSKSPLLCTSGPSQNPPSMAPCQQAIMTKKVLRAARARTFPSIGPRRRARPNRCPRTRGTANHPVHRRILRRRRQRRIGARSSLGVCDRVGPTIVLTVLCAMTVFVAGVLFLTIRRWNIRVWERERFLRSNHKTGINAFSALTNAIQRRVWNWEKGHGPGREA